MHSAAVFIVECGLPLLNLDVDNSVSDSVILCGVIYWYFFYIKCLICIWEASYLCVSLWYQLS